MADVASLAVGLYLNNAFTPQLTAVYRQAGDQSRRFVRGVQQDTKKAEVAYQHLASTIGGVASRLAGLAGVGFEQLNAAIQVLAEREVKGGQAGTALRNVILTLEKGTDKTLKPSVVGLVGALDTLAKKKLSTAQAVKLFGVENINAASILVDNRDKLEALTHALTGTQTAYEQSAIRVNNLNGDLMGLTSAFEGLVIQVGQSGNGPLRTGIQNITRATNALADNFTTVASVALYTLIPVLTTRLTAGLRESVAGWVAQQQAAKAAATQQAATARATLEQAQASRQLAQEQARYLAAQTAVNRANGIQLS
nr:phage tail tape measure protein [Candidatus Sodalis pierantonius]